VLLALFACVAADNTLNVEDHPEIYEVPEEIETVDIDETVEEDSAEDSDETELPSLDLEEDADEEETNEDETYSAPEATNELKDKLPSELAPIDLETKLRASVPGKNELAKGARLCYSVGDPHSQSYDGQIFHFQGVGQILLSKSSRMEVQARTYVVGKHPYFGVVSAYNQVAIRYNEGTKSELIEVNILWGGAISVKINGKAEEIKGDTKTKLGIDLWRYTEVVNKVTYPNLAIRTPSGNGLNLGWAAVFIFERPGVATRGLCGNNNGNAADDLKFNGQDKVITCPTPEDCVDSDPKKPIHAWGLTWMVVKGGNIHNIFDSSLKGVDHLKTTTAPAHFKDQEFKAKAKAFCRKNAKSYAFYFDCMFDAAETGNLKNSAEDAEIGDIIKKMKSNGKENPGRAKLLVVLSKMDVDLGIQRDELQEEGGKQKRNVKALRTKRSSAERIKRVDCDLAKTRERVNIARSSYEKSNGRYLTDVKQFNTNSKTWNGIIESNKCQIDIIKQMIHTAGDLVNVKDVDALPVDQEKLATQPELKQTFVELIAKAHRGESNQIKSILEDLLRKLEAEDSKARVSIANGKKNIQKREQEKKDSHIYYQDEKSKFDAANKKCVTAKRNDDKARAALNAAESFAAKDGVIRAKQLAEVKDEISMVGNLKQSIVQWGTQKNFKKCVSDLEFNIEEDGEVDEADEADVQDEDESWETLGDSIPIANIDLDEDVAAAVEELNADIE
jgi:hypothetical protein